MSDRSIVPEVKQLFCSIQLLLIINILFHTFPTLQGLFLILFAIPVHILLYSYITRYLFKIFNLKYLTHGYAEIFDSIMASTALLTIIIYLIFHKNTNDLIGDEDNANSDDHIQV